MIWIVVLVGMIGAVAFSNWRMQQAWRWWVSKEAQNRRDCADQIQNGLLQDLFALRLNLQSLSSGSCGANDPTIQLATAEKLHHRLNHLSAALLSPYLPENLPLALRTRLQQWQTDHPCNLQFELPTDWPLESLERSQIILTTLERLLEFALVLPPVAKLTVHLKQQTGRANLNIQLTHAPATETAFQTIPDQELKYLCCCFDCLMPGWCHYQITPQSITWQFGWKLTPVDGA